MLPWILGAVVVSLGAYLLDDAKSSNATARRAYDDACDDTRNWLEHKAKHAQKKDALDNLFKMKKAKRKVADSIYEQLQKSNQDFKTINYALYESKEMLSQLFTQKNETTDRNEKRNFQEQINVIQATRKEFFTIKEVIEKNKKELQARVKLANNETRMIQEEINRVSAKK